MYTELSGEHLGTAPEFRYNMRPIEILCNVVKKMKSIGRGKIGNRVR